MKTHDLARALMLLSRMLKAGQNVELKDWPGPDKGSGASGGGNGKDAANTRQGLAVLVGFSKYSKGQWLGVIEDWGLPLVIPKTDSARDVIGKVFKYLGNHPDIIERVAASTAKKDTKASPELSRVLSILLGKDKEEEKKDEAAGTGD